MKQKKDQHKIASSNCQIIVTSNAKCNMLANDLRNYRVDVQAVQETKLSRFGTKILTSNLNKQYLLYYSGSENKYQNRVDVTLSPEVKATFKPVNDRICQVTLKSDNNQVIHIISSYAPTLEKSKQNPKIRDDFYSKFNDLIKTHKSKHIKIVVADFNTKTGSSK